MFYSVKAGLISNNRFSSYRARTEALASSSPVLMASLINFPESHLGVIHSVCGFRGSGQKSFPDFANIKSLSYDSILS